MWKSFASTIRDTSRVKQNTAKRKHRYITNKVGHLVIPKIVQRSKFCMLFHISSAAKFLLSDTCGKTNKCLSCNSYYAVTPLNLWQSISFNIKTALFITRVYPRIFSSYILGIGYPRHHLVWSCSPSELVSFSKFSFRK